MEHWKEAEVGTCSHCQKEIRRNDTEMSMDDVWRHTRPEDTWECSQSRPTVEVVAVIGGR